MDATPGNGDVDDIDGDEDERKPRLFAAIECCCDGSSKRRGSSMVPTFTRRCKMTKLWLQEVTCSTYHEERICNIVCSFDYILVIIKFKESKQSQE